MIAALYKYYRAPSLSISASVAYFSIEHSALNDVQACVEKAIKLMISPCQKNPGVFGTIVITHDWNYGPIGHCDKFTKNGTKKKLVKLNTQYTFQLVEVISRKKPKYGDNSEKVFEFQILREMQNPGS